MLKAGSRYDQIHVLFDRYERSSIKAGTRERRTKATRPVRRVIENENVPVPNNWSNFLALSENKADLARFLSEHLIENAPQDKVIVSLLDLPTRKKRSHQVKQLIRQFSAQITKKLTQE